MEMKDLQKFGIGRPKRKISSSAIHAFGLLSPSVVGKLIKETKMSPEEMARTIREMQEGTQIKDDEEFSFDADPKLKMWSHQKDEIRKNVPRLWRMLEEHGHHVSFSVRLRAYKMVKLVGFSNWSNLRDVMFTLSNMASRGKPIFDVTFDKWKNIWIDPLLKPSEPSLPVSPEPPKPDLEDDKEAQFVPEATTEEIAKKTQQDLEYNEEQAKQLIEELEREKSQKQELKEERREEEFIEQGTKKYKAKPSEESIEEKQRKAGFSEKEIEEAARKEFRQKQQQQRIQELLGINEPQQAPTPQTEYREKYITKHVWCPTCKQYHEELVDRHTGKVIEEGKQDSVPLSRALFSNLSLNIPKVKEGELCPTCKHVVRVKKKPKKEQPVEQKGGPKGKSPKQEEQAEKEGKPIAEIEYEGEFPDFGDDFDEFDKEQEKEKGQQERAQDLADRAQQAADDAQRASQQAERDAKIAQEIANQSKSKEAQESSQESKQAAEQSSQAAQQSQQAANQSQKSANQGDNAGAQSSSQQAQQLSQEAIQKGQEASSSASDVISKAGQEKDDVTGAQKTAQQASNEAQRANQAAEQARRDAESASQAADESGSPSAQEAAQKSQEAADKATQSAQESSQAAQNAQEAANKGDSQSAQESAQQASQSASEAANQAGQASSEASKAGAKTSQSGKQDQPSDSDRREVAEQFEDYDEWEDVGREEGIPESDEGGQQQTDQTQKDQTGAGDGWTPEGKATGDEQVGTKDFKDIDFGEVTQEAKDKRRRAEERMDRDFEAEHGQSIEEQMKIKEMERQIEQYKKMIEEESGHRLSQQEAERMIKEAPTIASYTNFVKEMRMLAKTKPREIPTKKGKISLDKTLKRAWKTGGVPVELVMERPKISEPNLLLIVDISGSMAKWYEVLFGFMQEGLMARGDVFLFAAAGQNKQGQTISGVLLDGKKMSRYGMKGWDSTSVDNFASGMGVNIGGTNFATAWQDLIKQMKGKRWRRAILLTDFETHFPDVETFSKKLLPRFGELLIFDTGKSPDYRFRRIASEFKKLQKVKQYAWTPTPEFFAHEMVKMARKAQS